MKKFFLSNIAPMCLPHCLNVYPSNLLLIPSSFLPFLVVPPLSPLDSLSLLPTFPILSISYSSMCAFLFFFLFLMLLFPHPCLFLWLLSLFIVYFYPSQLFFDLICPLFQSVIVKSVERNAVNMYEARKFLLGLESNGVSCSSPSLALNPTTNGPSPSLICPVGLDILTSAGLGLSNLGRCSPNSFLFFFF